jgi:hypothetical protein
VRVTVAESKIGIASLLLCLAGLVTCLTQLPSCSHADETDDTKAALPATSLAKCLTSEGADYEACREELLKEPSTELKAALTQAREREGAKKLADALIAGKRPAKRPLIAKVQLLARILTARMEQAAVFSECEGIMKQARRKGHYGSRPGALGALKSFARAGPEDSVGYEYRRVSFGRESPIKRRVRYSEEQVKKGCARNAAARLALLEIFWKLTKGSEYESSELLHLFREPFMLCERRFIVPLALETLRDESRAAATRVAAVQTLDAFNAKEAVGYLLDLLGRKTVDEGLLKVLSPALIHLGDDSTLQALLRMEAKTPAKKECIEHAVKWLRWKLRVE